MSNQCYVNATKWWQLKWRQKPEVYRCGNKHHICPNCGSKTRDLIGTVTCRCGKCWWAFCHWPADNVEGVKENESR